MYVIKNRWYAILSSRELGAKRPLARRRFGLELVLWRDASGRVAVARDSCPHRRAKLSPGRVRDGCIECPFHGFRYDAEGTCRAIPAHPDRPIPKAMTLDMIPAREAHDLVWVWTGPDPAPDEPIPFFDLDGYTYAGSECVVPVRTHYTRAIENQLDFAHLPFVHRTTIGVFAPTELVVATGVDGDRLTVGLEGQEPIIEFLGPNIWRNKTGAVWQFLAFVPIDDERMIYYVRSYQRFARVPGFSWLVGRVNRALNSVIIGQDTIVVETQPAVETRLRELDELLVQSDGPIIAYRRWRERHRGELAVDASSPLAVIQRDRERASA